MPQDQPDITERIAVERALIQRAVPSPFTLRERVPYPLERARMAGALYDELDGKANQYAAVRAEAINELVEQGWSLASIATELGISKSMVQKVTGRPAFTAFTVTDASIVGDHLYVNITVRLSSGDITVALVGPGSARSEIGSASLAMPPVGRAVLAIDLGHTPPPGTYTITVTAESTAEAFQLDFAG